jgi:DNA methylase
LIKLLSFRGNLVVDPFPGSGTTAVVAAALGRRVYGCDLNPDACGWRGPPVPDRSRSSADHADRLAGPAAFPPYPAPPHARAGHTDDRGEDT